MDQLARDRPLPLISSGEAERHRKVQEWRGGLSGTCVGRGIQASRARNERGRIKRDARENEGERERVGIYSH
jgi:hypothetical protein